MPVFAMLSTIGPDGAATLRDNPRRLLEVNRELEEMGVKVLHQWALLGQWDFLNIIEAPDEATMAKVATVLSARGTLKTQTLVAIPVEEFLSRLQTG
ncbi:MAG: GYD domain-containing protein [Acidimicrobiales bacterium]|nr:MAG: GYD domain-containing protein [Acidimicrobiales bacterium]